MFNNFWPVWTVHVPKWARGTGLIGLKEISLACHVQNLFFCHHCKYWLWKTWAMWVYADVTPHCHNNCACPALSVSHHTLLVPHTCGPPPPLQHGDIRETRKFRYNHDERVEYVCQKYYTMQVRPYKTCNNGEWIGEEVKCYSKLPWIFTLTIIWAKKKSMKPLGSQKNQKSRLVFSERSQKNRFSEKRLYSHHYFYPDISIKNNSWSQCESRSPVLSCC